MGIFPSYLFLSLSIHVLRLASPVVTYRESFGALFRRYSPIIRDFAFFSTHHLASLATSSVVRMSASGDSSGESASHMTNHIPATDYATTYQSRLVDPSNGIITEDDLALLSHLNCSYFSSGGEPPTLLALKRHAQSLALLISKLSTKRTFAFIKTGGKPGKEAPKEVAHTSTMAYDAFDWLHDMGKPYDTTDEWHHVPLTALSNMVREESEKHGVSYHCPLHKVQLKRNVLDEDDTEPTPRFLWQTHSTLLQHANECLEILDSEYSDTGGILSLLPVDKKTQQQPTRNDAKSQQLQAARNTIIGQWIVHHQQLVSRMHELEINYANAIDMLEMDGVVPTELLSDAGTFVRANGQVPAYPQDRYILAGVDEDLDSKIHSILDEEESLETADDAQRREAGVVGDRMWRGEDEDGYERGLVRVDLTSRFYRIKGARKSPIVIMPIAFMHPRTEATRDVEARKTVVAIPQGRLPPWGGDEPVGEGAEGQSEELARLREERKSLVHENKQLQTVIDILQRDIKAQRDRFEREEQAQAAFDLQQMQEAERKKEIRRQRKAEMEEMAAQRQQAALEAEERREREAQEQEERDTREREAREARKKQRTKGGRHVLKPPRQNE